jgi:DUF4097 and DUF4098 domain-containing protein YvlB
MKKIVFSLLLATISFAVNAQFNSVKDPFLVKTLTNESFEKINAETSHGNISVSPVAAGEARIEVYIRSGANWDDKLSKEEIQQRLDENYTLDVSVSGGLLTAVARQKKMNFNIGKKSLSISFTIYTTQTVSTILRSSHGNISLHGLTGSQDIATSHGNLGIEKVSGKITGETSHGNISISSSVSEIDLGTSHGNIDVKNCEGTIKLATSNGDIQLKDIKGKMSAGTNHGNVTGGDITGVGLSATTSHGNVDLKDLSCAVQTSTSHGNINLSFTGVAGPVTIDNSNGNISLLLPKGKGIDLDLHAKGIRIDAMDNFSGSKDERAMKGTLNGGGATIKATTGKGTISLSFR